MTKPRVLPSTGNKNNTNSPTIKVHKSKYTKYAWGASSGSLAALNESRLNQFIFKHRKYTNYALGSE